MHRTDLKGYSTNTNILLLILKFQLFFNYFNQAPLEFNEENQRDEKHTIGSVSLKTYLSYLANGGGYFGTFLIFRCQIFKTSVLRMLSWFHNWRLRLEI